jgi:fatty-acyl-CoA synthase
MMDHGHLLDAGFAKWQLPDRVELLPAIPRTSVGKFDKKRLCAQLTDAAQPGGSS